MSRRSNAQWSPLRRQQRLLPARRRCTLLLRFRCTSRCHPEVSGRVSCRHEIAVATSREGHRSPRSGQDGPAHLGARHQGAMDLRAGSPATERRTRSRSLRGPILARTASSCTHDDDRLRFPPVSPAQKQQGGKKRINGPPPQPTLPAVRQAILELIARPLPRRWFAATPRAVASVIRALVSPTSPSSQFAKVRYVYAATPSS